MARPSMIFLLASLFSIFGESLYVARAAVFIANACSAALLFFIGKGIWGEREGVLASLFFLVAVLISSYQAYFVLTEQFMILFALIAIFLLMKSTGSDRSPLFLLCAGIALGIALFFKQFIVFLGLSVVLYYLCGFWSYKNRFRDWLVDSARDLLTIFTGFLIPVIAVVLYFWTDHTLGYLISDFFVAPTRFQVEPFWPGDLFKVFSIVWFFPVVAFLVIICKLVVKRGRNIEVLVALWFAVSLLIFLRPPSGHYLMAILPSACLLSSAVLIKIFSLWLSPGVIWHYCKHKDYVKAASSIIFLFIIIVSIIISARFAVDQTFTYLKFKKASFRNQANVADYIMRNTNENEKIYCFPNAPQLHFLTGRYPPSRIFYTHPVWVPDEEAELDLIAQIKQSDIRYIIVTRHPLVEHFHYIAQYIEENYLITEKIGPYTVYLKKG